MAVHCFIGIGKSFLQSWQFHYFIGIVKCLFFLYFSVFLINFNVCKEDTLIGHVGLPTICTP
jgi:hypothetical protein